MGTGPRHGKNESRGIQDLSERLQFAPSHGTQAAPSEKQCGCDSPTELTARFNHPEELFFPPDDSWSRKNDSHSHYRRELFTLETFRSYPNRKGRKRIGPRGLRFKRLLHRTQNLESFTLFLSFHPFVLRAIIDLYYLSFRVFLELALEKTQIHHLIRGRYV